MLTGLLGITGAAAIVYAIKRWLQPTHNTDDGNSDQRALLPQTVTQAVAATPYYDSYLTPHPPSDTDTTAITSCSYVQLDIDTAAVTAANDAAPYAVTPAHHNLLTHVVELTRHELYLGLNINTSKLTLDQISTLLGAYYIALTDISVKAGKSPLYSVTILLPVQNTTLRDYITAKLPDLQTIFCPTSDPSQLNAINAERSRHSLCSIQQYVVSASAHTTADKAAASGANANTAKRYKQLVIGGTFDHSHVGHKLLLTLGAHAATSKLVIGLSSDELLVNKKYATEVQEWSYRAEWLYNFIALINPSIECECVELHDMYGPSGDRAELDALVVSAETESGGKKVNEKRAENKLQPLELLVVKLAKSAGASDADKISSTLIRKYTQEQVVVREKWIESEWMKLCEELYVDTDIAERYWKLLYERYADKPQCALALAHMSHMLRQCETYTSMLANSSDVMLATFFHDYMDDTYVTPTNKVTATSKQNADMFHRFCTDGGLEADVYHVSAATVTAKHAVPMAMTPSQINDMKFFLDIDVSPLSYATNAYNDYWHTVKHVVCHSDIGVTEQQYDFQRRQQIQNLLQQDQIYETAEFKHRYEQKARYNLQHELQRLQLH